MTTGSQSSNLTNFQAELEIIFNSFSFYAVTRGVEKVLEIIKIARVLTLQEFKLNIKGISSMWSYSPFLGNAHETENAVHG